MGAWGYGPWENDTVLDWYSDFEKVETPEQLIGILQGALRSVAKSKKSYPHYAEARGAAEIVFQLELGGLQWEAIEILEKILNDSIWADEWREPNKIKASLTLQIEKLEKMTARAVHLTRGLARAVSGPGLFGTQLFTSRKPTKTSAAGILGISTSILRRILAGGRARPRTLERCPCCGRLTGGGSFVEEGKKLQRRLAKNLRLRVQRQYTKLGKRFRPPKRKKRAPRKLVQGTDKK